MATFVSLATLKARVYADDTTAYDTRLQDMLDNAESAVIGMTGYIAAEVVAKVSVSDFPLELKEAIYQLAASWFAQPEGVAPQQFHAVPYGISFLVKPFEKLKGGGRMEALMNAEE